jgi:hypothetical protein
VTVRLTVPAQLSAARAVVSGAGLRISAAGQGMEVTVPRVEVHEIVAFDVR